MADVIEPRERGLAAYARRAWVEAHEALALADATAPLAPDHLERLATAAYMLGRDDAYVQTLERAHHRRLDEGDALGAARCAFWIGMNLLLRGERGPAAGWFGRAGRLVEREGSDCVERGFLLLPRVFEHAAAGDRPAAIAAARDAAAIGERFGEADLFALASHEQGLLLIAEGRVAEGLRLLDEAMVAVTTGELSPLVNGFVYCGVITGCQAAYEPRRAQEWTAALSRWCEQQPDMVSFSGTCLVHRAEIMQLHGAWPDALEEARRAAERCALAANRSAAAQADYRRGEVHRLQGESAAAEEAYREARRGGHEPQPGLALLRLDQGNAEAAAAAVRRALGETSGRPARAGLLPAYVEIMLAVGDVAAARVGCDELGAIAVQWRGDLLGAMAAQARGAVELAEGDADAAHRLAAPGGRRVGRARRAVRDRAGARPGRPGVPRAGRRRHGRAGAGGGPRRVRAARRGSGPGPRRRARRPRRAGRRARADEARARGAGAGRGRPEQPGDRGGARHQRAHRRPPRAEPVRQARRVVAGGGHVRRVRAPPPLIRGRGQE